MFKILQQYKLLPNYGNIIAGCIEVIYDFIERYRDNDFSKDCKYLVFVTEISDDDLNLQLDFQLFRNIDSMDTNRLCYKVKEIDGRI